MPRSQPQPSHASALRRLLTALCLLAILAAGAYSLWFWKGYSRPGRAHYLRGLDAMSKNQPAQARREWMAGIKEDPSFAGCYLPLGDMEAQSQHYPTAALLYDKASQLSPKDGSAFLKLAQAELSLGNLRAAFDAAKRASELLPDDADAQGFYGIVAGKRQLYGIALPRLRCAHQMRPDNRDFLIGLADMEIEALDWAGAERDLAAYVQAHPADAETSLMMAVINNHKPRTPQNVKAGLDYACRAEAAGLHSARLYGILGQFYLDADRLDAALQAYQTTARLEPNREEGWGGLVKCYSRLGNLAKAAQAAARQQTLSARHNRIDELEEAQAQNVSDLGIGLELGHLDEEDGNHRAAQLQYEAMVRQGPADPRTRPALAAFYQRAGRPDLARQALRPDFMP